MKEKKEIRIQIKETEVTKFISNNVTKEKWFRYLRMADETKFDREARIYCAHDKGIWKLYTISNISREWAFVERSLWNEKEETLECEMYVTSSVQEIDKVIDSIF